MHQAPPHHPPFQQTLGEACFSASTCSEVIRVQSAKWSERERPAASRTSALSCLLRLNCPPERMKVFVAALFLLLLSPSTASASASYSQASESTCPCRAAMSKGTGAAGSKVTPRTLSDLCHHPWGLSPSCMLSRYLETLPFVSSWAVVQILLRLGSFGKMGQGYVRSPNG